MDNTATTKEWFSVKTLYTVKALGEPTNMDSNFDPESMLIEERVVLFYAKDFDDALNQADREAEEYCSSPSENIFGQKVVITYLKVANCFSIKTEPEHCVEIYSRNEMVDSTIPEDKVIDSLLGTGSEEKNSLKRIKFIDKLIGERLIEILK